MEQVVNNYYYNGRPGAAPNAQPEEDSIDWIGWCKKLWAHRKQFYKTLPAVFVVACLLMISIPNYYDVQVKLVPELGANSKAGGGLSALMGSFGLGGAASGGPDAVGPVLYPDLMNSQSFMVGLFDVQVQNQDSTVQTTYYKYLTEHQKLPWWSAAIKGTVKGIKSLFITKEPERPIDPFWLTAKQDKTLKSIRKKIGCSVDQKTSVITIRVTDQDPVICANLADSVCSRLQNAITDYRTKKSRQELADIQAQLDKARIEYEASKDALAEFNRSNWAIVKEDVKLQQQFLQNDMTLKYSAYSAFTNQLVSARTKLEESRPVYTVLDGASVPVLKAGPKRAMIVILWTFLAFILQAAWILRDELKKQFMSGN